MANIQLPTSTEVLRFLEEMRINGDGPYLVPVNEWQEHIAGNPRCDGKVPRFILAGSHVITDSDEFRELVRKLGNLHLRSQRLLTNIGPIWGAAKLEVKKIGPKGDIFDFGLRQPGSFRSRG